LVYQSFHVAFEVLIALGVKLNATEMANLLAIGEDLRPHRPLCFTERKALDRALKTLGIKRSHSPTPLLVARAIVMWLTFIERAISVRVSPAARRRSASAR
jgi:hypothetical protein